MSWRGRVDHDPESTELQGELRRELDKHGYKGIPIKDLRRELEDEGITAIIPPDRLRELLNRANINADEYMTYREFVNMMTGEEMVSARERSAMKRFLGGAINDIVPARMKNDFLANYSCCPPPIFLLLCSIAEIIVFVVYAVELEKDGIPTTASGGVPTYSPLIYNPRRRYEAWRFLTYMFLHQGYLHLIGNLIFQLLLGIPLELVHKWRVLIIYFFGVVAGSLAHSVTDHGVFLCGASGGCYAIIGGHIASVIVNWKEMNYKCCEGSIWRMLFSAPVRLSVLLLFATLDTSNAIYRRITAPENAKIGISAHIGGMLAGLLLGVPALKNINKLQWEKTLGWVTLVIYLVFVAFCILFNGVYNGYPATDWD